MRRGFKITGISLLALAGLAVVAVVVLVFVAQTEWFKGKVRERIVAVAEQATGGRVEINRFDYDWRALTAEISPFVLHGTESANEPPLFRAARIQVGLKIISAFKRQVDIASLRIDEPRLYVRVAPDGSTNVPSPKVPAGKKNFAEQLLDLKVGHFQLRDGFAEYNSRRIPLDVQGDHLQASLIYDVAGPRYLGSLSSRQLRIAGSALKAPVSFDFDSKFALQRNSIQIFNTTLAKDAVQVQLQGSVEDLASPRAALDIVASAPVRDLKQAFGLPLESRGEVSFRGHGSLQSSPFQYKLDGRLAARGLGLDYQDVAIRDLALASNVELTPEKLRLPDLNASALGGRFRGSVELDDFKKLAVKGTAEGFALRKLAQLNGRDTGDLNGTVHGSVILKGVIAGSGLENIAAQAKLDIDPGTEGVPVQGALAIDYDQRAGTVQFGDSQIQLGSTQGTFSGTLGQKLQVHLSSRNLNDVFPLFPLLGQTPPEKLPVELEGSTATIDATVAGPLANPLVTGKAEAGSFTVSGRKFDRVTASFDLERGSANLRTFTLAQGKARVEGQGRVSLRDWKLEDSSSVSALLSVSGVDIHAVAVENKIDQPVSGMLSATLHLSGSIESPLVSGNVEAVNVDAYGEHADAVRGEITYSPTGIEVSSGEVRSGSARIRGDISYNHPANDWKDGSLRFDISSAQLTLERIRHVQDFRQGLGGQVDLKATGAAKVVHGGVNLSSLNGHLSLRNAVVDGRRYGNLELTAATRLPALALNATVSLEGLELQGSGEWHMEGDYAGQAHIDIPRVSFSTLHNLTPGRHLREDLPFVGFLQGEATVTGPLNHPAEMHAQIALSTVQLSARPGATSKDRAAGSDAPECRAGAPGGHCQSHRHPERQFQG